MLLVVHPKWDILMDLSSLPIIGHPSEWHFTIPHMKLGVMVVQRLLFFNVPVVCITAAVQN